MHLKKDYRLFCLVMMILYPTMLKAHDGATGIVKERMDFFSRSKEHMKAIRTHIQDENFDKTLHRAEEIKDWAARIPDYFPEGSVGKPSDADPRIWSDFDGFKNAASVHNDAV
jgi:cytochrome c556